MHRGCHRVVADARESVTVLDVYRVPRAFVCAVPLRYGRAVCPSVERNWNLGEEWSSASYVCKLGDRHGQWAVISTM